MPSHAGMQTVICMKWGRRYPASYVNNLWAMIKRNTRRPSRLVCYTDDAEGIDPAVTTFPMLDLPLPGRAAKLPWRKIALWAPSLPGIEGDVLFLDLDIVITGSLDDFFDYQSASTYCVIENWTQIGSGIGNTSCYRFRVGAHSYIYDRICQDPGGILASHPNSQTYISRTISEKTFWPAAWCASFKHTLIPRWPMNLLRPAPLPPDTRVVCFTGKPDPDEARDGRWPAPWYKKVYKFVRPTPWIAEHWRSA
ncbi:MAG TPA: hypothetical protein VFZ16_08415 [Hyphomicrobiaceae bacterium]|nr:hypothetical protein [Hyphomicrobiaceae bacterium]